MRAAREVPAGEHEVRQYSFLKVPSVWAAAAGAMAILAWVVAPALAGRLGGDGNVPMAKALLVCFTAGLVWQFVLVAGLVALEQGGLRWPRVRQALWLRAPSDPRTGRRGGRVWLCGLHRPAR